MAAVRRNRIAQRTLHHNIWFCLCLCFCVLLNFLPTASADGHKGVSSFEIEVRSPVGFFSSPNYKVTIDGDGRVDYLGYNGVHWKGRRHARISQQAVEKLIQRVRTSIFFDLPGSYENGPCMAVDSSEGNLRIRLDGREKSVGTCNAPPIVRELMSEVVSVARVWRWAVFDPDELRLRIAHGWRVSEHMPQVMDDAIEWDAADIIRILVRNGADVDGVSSNQEHFLMNAVSYGHIEAARALLALGADWRLENADGENPATDAGARGSEMAKLFFQKGVNVDTAGSSGQSMLMNAVYARDLSTLKLLVEAGANVNAHNRNGKSALSIAEEHQKYPLTGPETARELQLIIDFLVAHGAVH